MNPGRIAQAILKLVAVTLLLGALGRQSYDYYTLLRWVVCCAFVLCAIQARSAARSGWLASSVVAALFFNPLLPVHLKRETWGPINLACAALLLIGFVVFDLNRSKKG